MLRVPESIIPQDYFLASPLVFAVHVVTVEDHTSKSMDKRGRVHRKAEIDRHLASMSAQ